MTIDTACRLCGACSLRPIHRAVPAIGSQTPSRFDVCGCEACGFVQTTPLPSADELRETYEAASYTWKAGTSVVARFESLYRQALVRADQVRALRWACEQSGGSKVLDMGCGDALLITEARRSGLTAFGVDYPGTPTWPGCDASWKRSADLETLSEPAESWDVVSLFHVVEHLRAPVEVLKRVHQWLRPNGVLVAQVPNVASIQAQLFGAGWYGLDVPRHLSHFTPETLTRLLEMTGYAVERVSHLSWRDNGPLFASSLLPELDLRTERERAVPHSAGAAIVRRLIYFAATWGALPLVLLEAALRRGGTITVFAKKT